MTGDFGNDHAALKAACVPGTALCTIVGIEGSYSRRLGAQLAVGRDGRFAGSLADGCLEHQLASDVRDLRAPETRRYGQGSKTIDFRLPCGSGLDILLDPTPDSDACQTAVAALESRAEVSIPLPDLARLSRRAYLPSPALRIFGEGPELSALESIAKAAGFDVQSFGKDSIGPDRNPITDMADRWTANILLFHDHEWEDAILSHALDSASFFIGAQGGSNARKQRVEKLKSVGIPTSQIDRIRSPVGAIASNRTPQSLALSILAEVAADYENLLDEAICAFAA
ncbi:MAG: hypothetical protein DI637_04215 [Citromicrobium sp.]|nr:MAG: hypothetical protein DI637_04215 [Citromicrobium sp.]